jgi:PAS domain S-box-containing protein
MRGRRQIFLLLAIMMLVALGVGGIILLSLYNAAFHVARDRLIGVADSRRHIIEAVAEFDRIYSRDYPGGALEATLSQLRDAQVHFPGFGETGEFLLAKLEDDRIVFLLPRRFANVEYPSSVPSDAPQVAPMRRALEGKSGTMISRGFRGVPTLSAYEPVDVYSLGIVAKLDLAEIRAPFIQAGLMAAAGGLTFVFLGTILFLQIGNPLMRQIEESERKYRSMFESAADTLLLVSGDGTILDANPAACVTYGFVREEFIGRQIRTIIHPDQHELAEKALRQAVEGVNFRRESVHVKKSGEYFPVDLQLSPILHKGRLAALLIARDITARKKAEQELQSSEARYRNLSETLEQTVKAKVAELRQVESLAAIGRMVSVVAHEVRNPLQNINMGVDTLKGAKRTEQEQRGILDEIEYGVRLLNNIVDELLDYSRPERLRYEALPVCELVRRALKMITPMPQNISIHTEAEQPEREINLDISRMIRVLINIISNAIEAMTAGGDIRIRSDFIEVKGIPMLKLTISDNGPGMEEEILRRVFEPFYTTKTRGTGLGLAISRKIIDAHGGTLGISSKIGEGTSVEIILPVNKP